MFANIEGRTYISKGKNIKICGRRAGRNEQINFALYITQIWKKLTVCNIAMAIVEFYFIGLLFAPYNVPAFQTLCDEFAQNGIGFITAVCFIVYRTYLGRMQYLSYFQYKLFRESKFDSYRRKFAQ